LRFFAPLLLLACAGGESVDDDVAQDSTAACEYPAAAEPMAVGEALAAYSWPEARHADGRNFPLSLAAAFCDSDPNIDWSPHDYMLFISVPAW
jgi:hypothetical protein